MDFQLQALMVGKLLLAASFGGLIGYERERLYKPAGLRTHMLVCLGSALFTMLSFLAFPQDPARVASYVVMGIGFIGAGTVLQMREKVIGLTTAASLWTTAAIGMAIALEYYLVAIAVTALVYLILKLAKIEKKKKK